MLTFERPGCSNLATRAGTAKDAGSNFPRGFENVCFQKIPFPMANNFLRGKCSLF